MKGRDGMRKSILAKTFRTHHCNSRNLVNNVYRLYNKLQYEN